MLSPAPRIARALTRSAPADQALWNGAGAGITTWFDPFKPPEPAAGNGYFAVWLGFLIALSLLSTEMSKGSGEEPSESSTQLSRSGHARSRPALCLPIGRRQGERRLEVLLPPPLRL